jgi:hypothetical protein
LENANAASLVQIGRAASAVDGALVQATSILDHAEIAQDFGINRLLRA